MRIICVPVKALDDAKSRLAGLLGDLERAALALAMAEDVLDAALAQAGWEVWVISTDEVVLEAAARRQARPVPEDVPGDGPSLRAAIRQVEQAALGAEADALAVVLADLPRLTPRALAGALHTLGPVVLAPATSDGGTNLLLRRPPGAIPSRFGRDSFRGHRRAAARVGLPAAVVHDPGLAFDVDGPLDLAALLASTKGAGRRTRSVCVELGLAGRLRIPAQAPH